MSNSVCPSLSYTGLTCDKTDEHTSHQTLTHRNNEEFIEWPIDSRDKLRWGVVQEKSRKKTSGTEDADVEEVSSEADVTTEDPDV